MEKASFSLVSYSFDRIVLELDSSEDSSTLSLSFDPSGEYISKEGIYHLSFKFEAYNKSAENLAVSVLCKATFRFNSPLDFNEIPNYFYPNIIAILYPYIRALVSTLTLQANVKPILLPTLNLSSLQEQLKSNTVVR